MHVVKILIGLRAQKEKKNADKPKVMKRRR